ncbi:MAG: hypothetical protein A2Y81_01770 [Nitrospirae bacterium RBG_13_43_8]|nr:MAG: hypothetical protein A2Y81_01770 [Nitrospirae bacterium RBG_13_43_8]
MGTITNECISKTTFTVIPAKRILFKEKCRIHPPEAGKSQHDKTVTGMSPYYGLIRTNKVISKNTYIVYRKISPLPSLPKRGIVPRFDKGRLGGIFSTMSSYLWSY